MNCMFFDFVWLKTCVYWSRILDINRRYKHMHVAGSLCFGEEIRYMGKTHVVVDLESFKRWYLIASMFRK